VERLEAFASRLIEGWSARLFGAKLQPVQIAKRVIRAMEAHQTISLSKTFVPNSYVVSLSPSDFAEFDQYRRSLEQDLSEAVLGAARDRNYTLLAYPTVEIERDEDLPPGDMRVSCALVDASGDEVAPDAKTLGAVESGLLAQGRGQTVIEPRVHLIPDPAFNGHFNVLRGYVAPLGLAGGEPRLEVGRHLGGECRTRMLERVPERGPVALRVAVVRVVLPREEEARRGRA